VIDEKDEEFDSVDSECQGCGCYGSLDDIGLCGDCSEKFERDVIRERSWDYSALAFGLPEEKREELRRQVVKEHGEQHELIVPNRGRH
jgi:hypothetical protein